MYGVTYTVKGIKYFTEIDIYEDASIYYYIADNGTSFTIYIWDIVEMSYKEMSSIIKEK